MTTQAFNEILDRHVRLSIVPQLTSPMSRFAVGAALGAGLVRAESMADTLAALGILKDGEIDTEKLRDALLGGFAASPEVAFEKYGVRLVFKREDAEAFLRELNVAPPQKDAGK